MQKKRRRVSLSISTTFLVLRACFSRSRSAVRLSALELTLARSASAFLTYETEWKKEFEKMCFGSEAIGAEEKKLGDNSNLFIVVSRKETEILSKPK